MQPGKVTLSHRGDEHEQGHFIPTKLVSSTPLISKAAEIKTNLRLVSSLE